MTKHTMHYGTDIIRQNVVAATSYGLNVMHWDGSSAVRWCR